jgi:PAS domain S-box-containing protein
MLPGYEFRVVAKSGKELWFSFKLNEIVWQNESALLYLLHNTTDQKEYEKQKRKNTLRSEILLEIHKRAFELDDEDLYQFVLDKAVAITDSKIGFFHGFDDDSNTIKLTAWNKETLKTCENPTETHYPIHMAGNWVDCVKEGKPIVYNNFKESPNQKGLPEGHVGLVRYMSIPVFNKGKVYYIFGIGNKEEDYTESDISSVQLIANEITKILEKRTYEQQIKRSTEKYLAIHNNAPLPFQSLNDDGNIVEVNPAWLKVMGYQMDEVIGKWYGDFLHEDYVEVFKRNFPKLKSVGKVSNVPFKLRTKGGIYIDIKLDGSSSYTSEGEFMQTYCTFKNVSEELKQQKKLEESNRFNRTLLETIPFPIEIVNEEGDILFINSVFEDLVGTDKVGHKCWEVYRDDKQQCEKCPLLKGITIGETNIIEADAVLGGRAFDVIHKSMLFNGEKALMEIFIETTERKKFENDLIAAKEKAQESDRLKTAFLANMSHEIRTPMNGILGFTNLLKEPGLTGEDQSRYIDIIIRSGDRMLNTVNDIIEISKIETGQTILTKQKVNVSRHLQTLFQFFQLEAKNKKLDFRLENRINEDDAEVITDKNKLSSILTNLIKNALKFTETGFVEIGGSRENEYFRFYVKDSGVGIPEDRLDAVFNRFEQADIDDARVFEGSGLGLAISKSYVEMLDGTISVESKLDKGTTFTVKFPLQMASKNSSVSEQSKVKPRVKRELSLLVAEDDEISRYHLEVLLKKISGNLTFVNNGKDAVEKCKNGSFDLILMDIKLPQMDGLEATRHIRSFNSEIIIIAQTAFALHGDKKKALDAGCNGYLSKPLSAERLKESLRANGF